LKLKIRKIKTRYWRPGTAVMEEILFNINGKISDGAYLVISEKALATAYGLVVDESKIQPGIVANAMAKIWMRRIWGGPLGRITGLKPKTITNLRNYPVDYGARHKQLALRKVGILQALRHYSEGGIDASNLPYSFVSLPLIEPENIAHNIREEILRRMGLTVNIIIADGDSTFSWRNLHITPRGVQTPGFIHFGGFFSYLLGRLFNLRERPTPVAYVGEPLNPDRMLWFTKIAHKTAEPGGGRTAWGMSTRFSTGLTDVSYDMLDSVEHTPIIIIRLDEEFRKVPHPEYKIDQV
jgi:F420-0:gamma-glutamyl ligase-like protein